MIVIAELPISLVLEIIDSWQRVKGKASADACLLQLAYTQMWTPCQLQVAEAENGRSASSTTIAQESGAPKEVSRFRVSHLQVPPALDTSFGLGRRQQRSRWSRRSCGRCRKNRSAGRQWRPR